MRAIQIAALTIALSLSACAREQRAPPPPPPPLQPDLVLPPAPATGVSDAGFVATDGSIDLFVIRSSELALRQSGSGRIHDFAEQMIADHEGTSGQLSLAGRRLNLLPSATLGPSEQALLDALQASPRFDADYVRDQRTVHQRAVALDSAYLARGRSPTLRPVAAAALPIEERHLRMIAYL
jgi:putative membrane protein